MTCRLSVPNPVQADPVVAAADRQRAIDLVAAVDAGGIPLLPARVNDIARRLGLEVSVHDRPELTIARIRDALGV